jgi:hypothetical protein
MTASHVVLFQTEAPRDKLNKYRNDQKIINFAYIYECYFKMMRLKTNQDDCQLEDTYEVKVKN